MGRNAMGEWTEFGVRQGMSISARSPAREVPEVAQFFSAFLAENDAALAEPFRGVTTDGIVTPRDRVRTGMATEAIREAAAGFLDSLDTPTRARMTFPFESNTWRSWFNPHINVYRHGVMLEALSSVQRNAFFAVPSVDAPWGFQLDGHHLVINCVAAGNELAMTPMFMGSEPCTGRPGPFAGIRVLDVEERVALDLIRSLDADQQKIAIQYTSIMPDAIPAHLRHPIDNRSEERRVGKECRS